MVKYKAAVFLLEGTRFAAQRSAANYHWHGWPPSSIGIWSEVSKGGVDGQSWWYDIQQDGYFHSLIDRFLEACFKGQWVCRFNCWWFSICWNVEVVSQQVWMCLVTLHVALALTAKLVGQGHHIDMRDSILEDQGMSFYMCLFIFYLLFLIWWWFDIASRIDTLIFAIFIGIVRFFGIYFYWLG